MKTRRSGSKSIWSSNHSRRCFRMSGRSCSMAWPVFFARHAPAYEEAMQPGDGDEQANRGQACALFLKRDVVARFSDRKDVCRPLFHPARAHIAVEGATPSRAAAARQLSPSSTAARSRERKSIERGCAIHAGLLHQHEF